MDHGHIGDSLYCLGLACGRDLLTIQYKRKLPPKKGQELKVKYSDLPEEDAERRPSDWECRVYSFPQTWGSTALGFGGMGGAAMTTAQVTVVYGPRRDAAVYFGKQFAYHLDRPNTELMADISRRDIADCKDFHKYHTV